MYCYPSVPTGAYMVPFVIAAPPGYPLPGNAAPGDAAPGNAAPGIAPPGDAAPGDAAPVFAPPGPADVPGAASAPVNGPLPRSGTTEVKIFDALNNAKNSDANVFLA